MWVPLGDDVKVGRNENQTNDMSIQPPSNSYDPYHVGENLECFINCMGPKVKVDPLGFQDHINVHKSNFEPNPNENLTIFGDTLKPLSPMFGDSLVSPTWTHNDVQSIVSSSNQEQGGSISHAEEKVLNICLIFPPSFKMKIFPF